MVPNARLACSIGRLDRDQIEAQLQPRQWLSIREAAPIEEAIGRLMDADALSVVDRLLRETEVTSPTSPNLDDDKSGWRARVHGHEIELVAADVHISTEDGPAIGRQARRDKLLRRVAAQLGVGPRPVR